MSRFFSPQLRRSGTSLRAWSRETMSTKAGRTGRQPHRDGPILRRSHRPRARRSRGIFPRRLYGHRSSGRAIQSEAVRSILPLAQPRLHVWTATGVPRGAGGVCEAAADGCGGPAIAAAFGRFVSRSTRSRRIRVCAGAGRRLLSVRSEGRSRAGRNRDRRRRYGHARGDECIAVCAADPQREGDGAAGSDRPLHVSA